MLGSCGAVQPITDYLISSRTEVGRGAQSARRGWRSSVPASGFPIPLWCQNRRLAGRHLAAWRCAARSLALGGALLRARNARLLAACLSSWRGYAEVETRRAAEQVARAVLGRAWGGLRLLVARGVARRAAAAWGRRRALGLGWAAFGEGCARSSRRGRWQVRWVP